MELSLTKILLLALVVFIIFGGGKLSSAMKDLGSGIRNFKKGLQGEDENSDKEDKNS